MGRRKKTRKAKTHYRTVIAPKGHSVTKARILKTKRGVTIESKKK